MSLETYGTLAAVFICAGLAYSLAGYKAKVSKYLRGDESVKFSASRLAKTAGLGVFLGLVAFGSEELLNGDTVHIAITDPGVFAKQVAATMGIIYAVDKLIIAGSDGGTRKTAKKVDDNIPTDTTEIVPSVETFELPPGKTGGV